MGSWLDQEPMGSWLDFLGADKDVWNTSNVKEMKLWF